MYKIIIVLLFSVSLILIVWSRHFQVPTLNLSLGNGVIFVFLISFVTCLLLYMSRKFNPFEKHGLLFLVRTLHYFTLYVMIFYIIIFNAQSDWVYLLFLTIIMSHWFVLKNECILSYWESKLVDPKYVMGEDPYRNIFIKLIVGDYITWCMILLTVPMFLNFGIVLWRIEHIYFPVKIIIITIIFFYQIKNNFNRLVSTN